MLTPLPIITIPTPSLRERSVEVDRNTLLSEDTQTFITQMIPTMYGDDGIGLAAPQVGKNIRICVIGKDALPKQPKMKKGALSAGQDIILVNPAWERASKKTEWDTEGCLSVPGVYGKVRRYKDIAVTAWDDHGNELAFDASAFFARVIQHEVDHLNGILFIDKAKDIYTVEKKDMKRIGEKLVRV